MFLYTDGTTIIIILVVVIATVVVVFILIIIVVALCTINLWLKGTGRKRKKKISEQL